MRNRPQRLPSNNGMSDDEESDSDETPHGIQQFNFAAASFPSTPYMFNCPNWHHELNYVCPHCNSMLWSGLGHIHILAMGCSAVENRGIGKGSSKLSFETEDCSGMTWAESAEGWKTEGLCLMKVEIKHDLEGRNKNRN